MGLLSIIKKIKQKEKELRILILYGFRNFAFSWFRSGLDNAGKTTIVKKFNGEPTDTISPTLGFTIKTIEYEGYAACTEHATQSPI